MPSAYEIVMDNRKELVNKILTNMRKGYIWSPNAWSSKALTPHNPVSGAYYLGGNRIRLMMAAIENNYQDPRWVTYKQAEKCGWSVKKGEKSVLLEKWIFEETKSIENDAGEIEKVEIELSKPKVSYFRVFNAEQIQGIPELKLSSDIKIADITTYIKNSSQCKIVDSISGKACYYPKIDQIELPPEWAFKSAESYLSVLIHEMSHSTGHPDRLNRSILNQFGTPDYAREELRAELGSAFMKANLELPLSSEQLQDHSNYLLSWIQVLEKDPNEFFRACRDAEQISDYLYNNYAKVVEAALEHEETFQEYSEEPETEPEYFQETTIDSIPSDEIFINGQNCQLIEEWESGKMSYLIARDINYGNYFATNGNVSITFDRLPSHQEVYQGCIRKELINNRFTPTPTLLKNISDLHSYLGENLPLSEIAKMAKNPPENDPVCRDYLEKISSECKHQEIQNLLKFTVAEPD